MEIEKAKLFHLTEIVRLHKVGIPTGFLSSLPDKALELLYLKLIQSEIVFVAVKNQQVVGFISCAINIRVFYKRFIIRNIFRMGIILLPKVFTRKFLNRLIETLTIPFKYSHKNRTKNADENVLLQCPELLSIVVDNSVQGEGIGRALLDSLESFLISNKIAYLRVVAGDNLESANKFYLKNGFKIEMKTNIHKGTQSNIYFKVLKNVQALF